MSASILRRSVRHLVLALATLPATLLPTTAFAQQSRNTAGKTGQGPTAEQLQKFQQLTPEQRQQVLEKIKEMQAKSGQKGPLTAEQKKQIEEALRGQAREQLLQKGPDAIGVRRTNRLERGMDWADRVRANPGNTTTQGGNIANQGGNVQSQFGNAGNQFGNASQINNQQAQAIRDRIDQRARGETKGLLTPGTQDKNGTNNAAKAAQPGSNGPRAGKRPAGAVPPGKDSNPNGDGN